MQGMFLSKGVPCNIPARRAQDTTRRRSTGSARDAFTCPQVVGRVKVPQCCCSNQQISGTDSNRWADVQTADELVLRLADVLATSHKLSNTRVIAGVAGAPGSGKSTMARHLRERVNEALNSRNACVVVPMDGYHTRRADLNRMENATLANARRGAHWTFDADRFADGVERLASAYEKGDVRLPSFDHGVGDPVDDDVLVPSSAPVVIVEGLYLYLTDDARTSAGEQEFEGGDDGVGCAVDVRVSPAWQRASKCMQHKFFIDADVDGCMRRVRKRHLAAWGPKSNNPVKRSVEEIDERVKANDARNAILVYETIRTKDVVALPFLPLSRP